MLIFRFGTTVMITTGGLYLFLYLSKSTVTIHVQRYGRPKFPYIRLHLYNLKN